MSPELIYLLILAGASVLFISGWLSMEVTALLIILSLAFTQILTPAQALSGFANTATLTIGAMFILSEGLIRTGALENVTIYLAEFSRGNSRRLLVLLGLTVPIASAFINNTPVVAMMVPVIISLSLRHDLTPSKLLIPVSYFAILGGTLTLIGTSTNILVNELNVAAGHDSLRMFAFAPLGLIYMLVGGVLIVVLSEKVLPDRRSEDEGAQASHHVYVAQFRVPRGSALAGKVVSDVFQHIQPSPAWHRRLSGIRRLSTVVHTESVPPTELRLLAHRRPDGSLSSAMPADGEFHVQDTVLVSGIAEDIIRFKSRYELLPNFGDGTQDSLQIEVDPDRITTQAVVLSNSSLIGCALQDLHTLTPHQVTVLGVLVPSPDVIHVNPQREIRSGDALLLEGNRRALHTLRHVHKAIFIEGRARLEPQFRKNSIALLIMAAVILSGTFTGIPIVLLALAGALAMILTGCLNMEEAFQSLGSRTLMLMAGTIPLGIGMQESGVAAYIVSTFLQGSILANLTLTVSILYLLASVLTQLISNAAVAVLFVPIALGLANTLQIDPLPLLVTIAFGASASFMSPTGYQTNAIVMEPGGYTYTDYMRLGVPLQIVMWLIATVAIPLIYA